MIRYIFLASLFLIGSTVDIRSRQQSNKCGPKSGPFLDKFLKILPLEHLIPCCHKHDQCYDRCNSIRTECDDDFRQCLYETCDKTERDGFELWIWICHWSCKRAADIMYHAAKSFGSDAFSEAQKENCALKDFWRSYFRH